MSATDHRYRNVVRIAGSSTTGAFVLMLGIDCCWRSGLREMLLYQIGASPRSARSPPSLT